jgi:predicted enzyme related to lactoylglutathione lyase
MANAIDYIELAVDDVEQAKAFYGKALGWACNDYGPDYAGTRQTRQTRSTSSAG